MKVFRIETAIRSTKTIEYFIKADSEEEALRMLCGGEVYGEGKEVEVDDDWGSEEIFVIEEMDEMEY